MTGNKRLAMKDSGIPWLGDVPSTWQIGKIKNIFSILGGSTPNSETPEYWGGDISWITPSDMEELGIINSGRRFLTTEGFNACGVQMASKGSIIVSTRAPIGKVNIAGRDICTSQGCKTLENKNNDNRFTFYFLFGLQDVLNNLGKGTTFLELSAQELCNFTLVIPPISEQTAIADFLDTKCENIDTIIALEETTITELNEYKNQLAINYTTKGLGKSKKKQSGIDWIGEIPEHWQVLPLLAIFKEHSNKNYGMKENNLLSLSYGNIIRKDINTDTGLLPENFEGYNIVEKGDIVLRLTDMQNDQRSLRTGLVRERGIITSAYITIRNHINANPDYFRYLLHSTDICKIIYNFGSGIRQNLTFAELKHMILVLPPKAEQDKIVAFLDKKYQIVDKLISIKQQKISELKEYKKSLIYEYVTGKKRPPKGVYK